MDGMAMGSMSMGGMPALIDFPKFYWAVVGSAIGVACLVNIYNHILYRQRMFAASRGALKPAKPKSLLFQLIATTYAIARESSNFYIRIPLKKRVIRLPTVGRTSLISANVAVLIVLCFYGFDLSDRWSREDIGYRCGFVTIAQLPLIFLLSGKNNIIGFLTGISYERLNWIHRWCARCMLLTATIHMGYFFADWAPYNYIGTELKENTLVWKGIAAWAILVWIVFSSMTPIRGWCYEFFVMQHLVSFAALLGFIYIHTPAECHAYVWIPVGLFWFDRVVRILLQLYANVSLFHPRRSQDSKGTGLWACKAEFVRLPHNATRIIIKNPPISWTPGQHVFLSCHSIVPLQSHPFTVASIPADGKMEFLVKAETGGTKRIFRHAQEFQELATTSNGTNIKTVAIEGPYGCIRPLRQFDSVVLFAGSTGATFTIPLLRDMIEGWQENASTENPKRTLLSKPTGAVTRHIRFVWVIKSKEHLGWFSEQLSATVSTYDKPSEQLKGTKLEMTVYVTCDDTFTEDRKTLVSSITVPRANGDYSTQRNLDRYTVEYHSRSPSLFETEKEKGSEAKQRLTELTKAVSESNTEKQSCGPNGTCCCRTTIDDSLTPDEIAPCCCNKGPDAARLRPTSGASSTSISSTNSKSRLFLHPSISVFSGRPDTRAIIRKSLEQAMGESGVVVCGPQGLVADIKHDVCALSDERAVHKGTGAQGIYLHTESFGY